MHTYAKYEICFNCCKLKLTSDLAILAMNCSSSWTGNSHRALFIGKSGVAEQNDCWASIRPFIDVYCAQMMIDKRIHDEAWNDIAAMPCHGKPVSRSTCIAWTSWVHHFFKCTCRAGRHIISMSPEASEVHLSARIWFSPEYTQKWNPQMCFFFFIFSIYHPCYYFHISFRFFHHGTTLEDATNGS